jgi:hypothetical protein
MSVKELSKLNGCGVGNGTSWYGLSLCILNVGNGTSWYGLSLCLLNVGNGTSWYGLSLCLLNICGFEFKIEFKKTEIKYLNGSLKFVEIDKTEIAHH